MHPFCSFVRCYSDELLLLLPTNTKQSTIHPWRALALRIVWESKRRAATNHFLLLPLHEFAPILDAMASAKQLDVSITLPAAAATILNPASLFISRISPALCVGSRLLCMRPVDVRGFFIFGRSSSRPHLLPPWPSSAAAEDVYIRNITCKTNASGVQINNLKRPPDEFSSCARAERSLCAMRRPCSRRTSAPPSSSRDSANNEQPVQRLLTYGLVYRSAKSPLEEHYLLAIQS